MSRGDVRLRAPEGDAYNQIGQRLRERRLQLDLTQDNVCARLAEVTGRRWIADRIDVLKLEKSTRTATDHEIFALSVALECDPIWLLVGEQASMNRAKELSVAWKASPASEKDRRPRPRRSKLPDVEKQKPSADD